MNKDKLEQLRISSEDRARPKRSSAMIFVIVGLITLGAAYYAWPRLSDKTRVLNGKTPVKVDSAAATGKSSPATNAMTGAADRAPTAGGSVAGSVLTLSGYLVNRERIELSPRFMGVVKWIGVKKGDSVTNGQVVVLLDDAEYRARLHETEGRLENAKVAVRKAELDFQRAAELVKNKVEMQKSEDDARLALESARASVREIEGQVELNKTYLDWTVIKSPVNGVVLEKLVDPNELVVPQSFGGTRGPSTALISVADLNDLQVEIDVNETSLAKVFMGQKCKISPDAYQDRVYDGYVAEIAPEANRAKGTLQIKVQISKPDRFLTPELSAKVDFLK